MITSRPPATIKISSGCCGSESNLERLKMKSSVWGARRGLEASMSEPVCVCVWERAGWGWGVRGEGRWARFMDTKLHAHPQQARAAHTRSTQPAAQWLPWVPAIKREVSPPARVLHRTSTDWYATADTPPQCKMFRLLCVRAFWNLYVYIVYLFCWEQRNADSGMKWHVSAKTALNHRRNYRA